MTPAKRKRDFLMTDKSLENLPVDSFKDAAPYLRRPFTVDAVRWKVQATYPKNAPTTALCVAYIDARLVVERLNMVCPHLWFDDYEPVGSDMLCSLTIDGITRRDLGSGYVGKGLYSDALKRAAVKFGIGVSLYATTAMHIKGPNVRETTANGKKSLALQPSGEAVCRNAYKGWLEQFGVATFGEPLDHGDNTESVGDVEAYVTPQDVAAEGEPTEDQRKQVSELTKALKLTGDELAMEYRAHGIEQGLPATRAQVELFITSLQAKLAKQAS